MDFQFFIDTLNRRKWLLMGVSLLAAIATLLVMLQMPQKYRANAQVATGIIDYKGVRLERENPFVQKFQVENAFSNLITNMQGRATLNKLSELMLTHDLTSDNPFREPDWEGVENVKDPSSIDLDAAKRVLISRMDSTNTSMLPASSNGVRISKIAEAYGYDFDNLRKELMVSRIGDTDYLDISFVTKDPELSYFMVSKYIEMFINDFKTDQSSAELKELDFYTMRVSEKKHQIDSLQSTIDSYKRGNSVVDLDEQQRAVVGQLRDIEQSIEMRRREIRGYENALKEIKAERTTAGSGKAKRNAAISTANIRLDRTKRELQELLNKVDRVDDPAPTERLIEAKREELQARTERVASLKRLGENKVEDRIVDLQQQELEAEIELQSARKAVTSMQREAKRLRGRTSGLVNDEAYLASLSTELDLYQKEYNELVGKKDGAEVIYSRSEHPLAVVEPPEIPEEHESRQIPIVTAFSAVATGTMFALGLFLVTLLDNKLRSPDQLRTLFKKDALATLTRINTKKFSLLRLFGNEELPKAAQRWIEGIRSLRYSVEQSGKKIIQITSLDAQSGKSTVIAGLAKSFSRANERVLLLDLNFKNNTLSAYSNIDAHSHPFELNYDPSKMPKANGWFELDGMDIVGNMGRFRSLAEVLATSDFKNKLDMLVEEYDHILIESAALNLYADSRELAAYVDSILCVLDADSKVDAAGRESMAWLEAQGPRFSGYVLNRVELKMLK
ncbi:MAG: GumC family protein [Saprospiraceae bacterium]